MNEQKKEAWQALQHFYKMKSVLLPEFMERNNRNLGDIESKLIKQWRQTNDKPTIEDLKKQAKNLGLM